jgi:hypothetical protein
MTRIIVALKPPDRNADLICLAKLVAGSLAKEPLFAEATPPLAVFEAHIGAINGRPADAASIAESSGMSVKRASDFDVKPGAVEGSVHH